HRDGDAAGIALISQAIDVGEMFGAVHVVAGHLAGAELPALRTQRRLDQRERDDLLKPLELAEDHGAVRPWAGERDVEVIAARLGRKATVARQARAAVRR